MIDYEFYLVQMHIDTTQIFSDFFPFGQLSSAGRAAHS